MYIYVSCKFDEKVTVPGLDNSERLIVRCYSITCWWHISIHTLYVFISLVLLCWKTLNWRKCSLFTAVQNSTAMFTTRTICLFMKIKFSVSVMCLVCFIQELPPFVLTRQKRVIDCSDLTRNDDGRQMWGSKRSLVRNTWFDFHQLCHFSGSSKGQLSKVT